MLQHIWKHQTRGVNRFINELKHLKCIFIFYLKCELTSKDYELFNSFYRTVTISLRRFKESDGREKSIIFQLQDGTVLNLRPSKTPGAKPGTCQYTCMSMKVRGL